MKIAAPGKCYITSHQQPRKSALIGTLSLEFLNSNNTPTTTFCLSICHFLQEHPPNALQHDLNTIIIPGAHPPLRRALSVASCSGV